MNKSFLEWKNRNAAVEEEKNHIVFGLMSGIVLSAVGALNWLSATGPWEVVCICIFLLGVLLFMLGFTAPSFLKYPYKAFRLWGNAVGKSIFAVVLAVFYFLLIFPVGLLLRHKREAQGYFTWDQVLPEPRSMFADIVQTDSHDQPNEASYFSILYKLFSTLVANRKFILIPVVVLLVIVGLILFFVSSNVMTVFIYTIF